MSYKSMIQFKKQLNAQTAMELAVFGAILIFAVGIIVRQSLGTSYIQNQQLKAMRMAMTKSYSGSILNNEFSRNTSQIMYIEDRLTANSAKYGAIDRIPYIVSGAATYSKLLFMPYDYEEENTIPLFDMFVNGREFTFTTARYKSVDLTVGCANASPCPDQCKGDCTGDSRQVYPDVSCFANNVRNWIWECADYSGRCGIDACVTQSSVTVGGTTYQNCTTCCIEADGDCNVITYCYPPDVDGNVLCVTYAASTTFTCSGTGTDSSGNALSFTCVAANPNATTGVTTTCTEAGGGTFTCDFPPEQEATGTCTSGTTTISNVSFTCSISEPTFSGKYGCVKLYELVYNYGAMDEWDSSGSDADDRFDLNRDGPFDVPATERDGFAWQWGPVDAINETDGDTTGNGIVYCGSRDDCAKSAENTEVDVDCDLKVETIMSMSPSSGSLSSVGVLDAQDGDMDFTWSENDINNKPRPGLTKDVRMYTRVWGGTYLLIEEGKLYDPYTRQFIRTAQKNDQIDIIERVFQLSNDTGRFCPGGSPSNGVEACDDCFSAANISRICMDTANLLIFMRSRIVNLHGRKWITDTSDDSYVNFAVPSSP
jgi:hypothetical protein